jgi:tRNA threonylcarbamoyladenosine biosynthesis protein TsaB
MLLAIDTSTRIAGLALCTDEQVISERTWLSVNNHTVELMPAIVQMLQQQRVTVRDLTGVAVAVGPGSFTGLRIGLSVAKGLCYALSIPLVGVPTLDALAHAHARLPLPVCASLPAGRGRLCAGFYRADDRGWHRVGDFQLLEWAALAQQVDQPTWFCGEITNPLADYLREHLGENAHLAPPASALRRPAYLAELGQLRLMKGESDDIASLTPLYLH